jgi:hypothetical protein
MWQRCCRLHRARQYVLCELAPHAWPQLRCNMRSWHAPAQMGHWQRCSTHVVKVHIVSCMRLSSREAAPRERRARWRTTLRMRPPGEVPGSAAGTCLGCASRHCDY